MSETSEGSSADAAEELAVNDGNSSHDQFAAHTGLISSQNPHNNPPSSASHQSSASISVPAASQSVAVSNASNQWVIYQIHAAPMNKRSRQLMGKTKALQTHAQSLADQFRAILEVPPNRNVRRLATRELSEISASALRSLANCLVAQQEDYERHKLNLGAELRKALSKINEVKGLNQSFIGELQQDETKQKLDSSVTGRLLKSHTDLGLKIEALRRATGQAPLVGIMG